MLVLRLEDAHWRRCAGAGRAHTEWPTRCQRRREVRGSGDPFCVDELMALSPVGWLTPGGAPSAGRGAGKGALGAAACFTGGTLIPAHRQAVRTVSFRRGSHAVWEQSIRRLGAFHNFVLVNYDFSITSQNLPILDVLDVVDRARFAGAIRARPYNSAMTGAGRGGARAGGGLRYGSSSVVFLYRDRNEVVGLSFLG